MYPSAGEPTDHAALDLPDHAHHIAEALLIGPLPLPRCAMLWAARALGWSVGTARQRLAALGPPR